MNMFRKLISLTIAVAVFAATATGAFAANLGREQTREYTVSVNTSFTAGTSNVAISGVNLPFDAGSVRVSFESCTGSGNSVTLGNGTYQASTIFHGSSGQAVFDFTSEMGIVAGSDIYVNSNNVSATITSLTFYKENSPGADYYDVDIPSGLSAGYSESNAAVIETYFPFNVTSFDISYTNSSSLSANLYYRINGTGPSSSVATIPKGSGTKRIYLTSSVDPTNVVFKFWRGYMGNITITGIRLNKENQVFPDTLDADLEYTDYEEALQTAAIFKNGSNIYKSKNAIRYMSYDNTDTAAFTDSGKLYAPGDAIALALGLYKEEAEDSLGITVAEAAEVPNQYIIDANGYLTFKAADASLANKTMLMDLVLDRAVDVGELTFDYEINNPGGNNRNFTVNDVNVIATGNPTAYQSFIPVSGFDFVSGATFYYMSNNNEPLKIKAVVSRTSTAADWSVKVFDPVNDVLIAKGTLPAAGNETITKFGLSRYLVTAGEEITVRSLSATLKDLSGNETVLCRTGSLQNFAGNYSSTAALNGACKCLFRAADNSEITLNSCLKNAAGDRCYSVKEIAEAFGYTALESGDYLIIDKYKVRANEILGNSTVLNGLISEFGSYEAADVTGKTWYVSANASAGGDGSEASPFKTIQEAANRATAGDRVIIKGGTYRETVTPANSGTAKNPIIFEAASGEQVTVSAFEEISGFRLYYDGIYVAKLPTKLDFGSDFIMYGGDVLVEGRQPNANTSGLKYPSNVTSPLWHTKGSITTPTTDVIAESSTELSNGRDSALRNSTYVGFKGLAWSTAYGKVVSSSRTKAAINDLSNMVQYGVSGDLDWGYLTNSKMTLDMPGEWYAKNGILYIIPPNGVSPESLKVEAKQRYTTFDLTRKSCIQLKNINTIGGSILMGEGSELNIVDGGTHKFTSHFTYPFTENGDSYGNFSNFTKGKSGNYVGGKNNAIINTRIDTGAGAGIILGGRYGYVAGNTILDTSYAGLSELSGILLASSSEDGMVNSGGHNIHFNTVSKTGRAALGNRTRYINDNSENERVPFIGSDVSYNDFSYSNLLARDSGIIYLHGCSMGNDLVKSEFHHNVLSNSAFNGFDNSVGITLVGAYADNYTANGIYHNNVVYYEGDFVYDKTSYDPSQIKGDELYINHTVSDQDYARWGRTYSTFEMKDNKGVLHCANGFDKTNSSNFPSGKIFKYGA